jgi:hypothetical protein
MNGCSSRQTTNGLLLLQNEYLAIENRILRAHRAYRTLPAVFSRATSEITAESDLSGV